MEIPAAAWALLCFGLFIWVSSAEQENITAESGQDVTLPGRAPNNDITVVEWSRADLKLQHVLVCWDGTFLPEEQHPSFKDRVDLQDHEMKDGDVSLILKNVTVNDTGTYECQVQRDDDNVVLVSTIHLRVSPPPPPPPPPPPGPGGGATEDEEEEDGGKQGGVSRGRPGLIVSLSVPAVLLVAAVLIYCKHKLQSQHSRQPV